MDYKKLIIDSGKKLIDSGFTIETWGNISVKDEETGLVYLTPSGMDYCNCTTDDVVVCNLDGQIVEGHRKPTIETELHLSVYRNRPEVKAVVHTHPIYSTVFSCMGEGIPLLIDEAAQALGAPVKTANYALPGTKELAEECIKALGKEANACLLQSHGAVCVGESMEAAFKVANVLEVTAQIYQLIRSTGKDFVPLSEENIKAMAEFAKYKYGQGK
ncbi:class II aldolase/adducin family protein [Vallitalea maricola]|uniref:Class II aldolase/adducin family protein n=1 Tax=Vallitalea maricola TaxID=3074433 RepID=A0ACB5UF46_9FIRM|nr:class II aldolase/adducin family protein [Vallitalea sp. AN17-2]